MKKVNIIKDGNVSKFDFYLRIMAGLGDEDHCVAAVRSGVF